MAWRACTTPGCGTLHEGTGRCSGCKAKAEQKRRPDGNPYASAGHQAFRAAVLAKNPRCICAGECGQHTGWCGQVSTVADHDPHERVDLIAMGLDPDDPKYGKGKCKGCHDRKTARTKAGGWNDAAR